MTDTVRKKAENAVVNAGRIFLDTVLDSESVIRKGLANYVTMVDFKVQEFLVEELEGIISGSNIITEESSDNRFDLDKPTWILDPVDGTTNLMYGFNLSSISLALFVEGMPKLGIVYNPFTSELFSAERGKGAFLNGKRVSVRDNNTLESSLICFGTSPYAKSCSEKTFSILEKVYLKSLDVRRTGSAAIDIAYVACGRISGFFEMELQPWDYAGGMVILEEAGGKITDWHGMPVSVARGSSILATNGLIHEGLLEIIGR